MGYDNRQHTKDPMNTRARNIVKCLRCADVIESKHVHDFVGCSCGAIWTDGGSEYIRRGGDPALMKDLSSAAGPVEED
jgi:hypothetical protein